MVRLSALTAMAWSGPWSCKPNGVPRNSVTLSQRHLLINHVPFLAPCLTDELLFVKNSLVKTEGIQEVSLQEFSSHAGTTTSSDSGTLNSHKRTPPQKKECLGFPGGSEVKASACTAGDPGSIPGLGRSPGEGNDNPLQCSCQENPMDGGAW